METTVTVPPTAAEPGLLLRPWTEQDIPAMLAGYRDPLMRRWMRRPIVTAEQSRESIEARRADRQAGRAFSFAVLEIAADGIATDPVVGGPVGGVVLSGLAGEAALGEVGYWVAAHARGRGIAPRALNALCEWAFGLPRPRPLERLELIHSVANPASCRVADKAGFTLSTVLPPLPPEFPDDGHLHLRLTGTVVASLP